MPPSSSEPASGSFARLHPEVQRWLHRAGWSALRDAQERAIPPILDGRRDVLIAAATAAGKTEAAFLPVCSALLAAPGEAGAGVSVLYLAPLKALINDQFARLEDLAGALGLPVHRWHGDVDSGRKRRLLDHPAGLLLITPESLEALFVLRGPRLAAFFGGLRYVVVDELHAFLGSERGRQLQSLLHRLEFLLRRRVPRIGLSATLGDLGLAAEALRPNGAAGVEIIDSQESGQELLLQLRGYRTREPDRPEPEQPEEPTAAAPAEESEAEAPPHVDEIAGHLYLTLRGSDHLIFANSRKDVELYADRLRLLCERDRVPNEFLPHHGSLSKPLREQVEERLKRSELPFSAVCTSTLEMGIDIGDVVSIAQIGAPFSVAALRQRLGRSGRRTGRSTLRLYVAEPDDAGDRALDGLRPALAQSVAMLELLVGGWCEPPGAAELHLSTLVHQVLSLLAQYGGATARDVWTALVQRSPFAGVDRELFQRLLRSMGQAELLEQSEDGTLLPGPAGEHLIGHYSFYSVFETAEEFRVVHRGRVLGTMAFDLGLVEGLHVVFAGRRWQVVAVDAHAGRVEVEPSTSGRAPRFEPSAGGEVHGRVRQRMRQLYGESVVPRYLDAAAAGLLQEGRDHFLRLGLAATCLVEDGPDLHLLVWDSDRVVNTLQAVLVGQGLAVASRGFALSLADCSRGELMAVFQRTRTAAIDPVELASAVLNKQTAKYSWALGEELLCRDYASSHLDGPAAERYLDRVLEQGS